MVPAIITLTTDFGQDSPYVAAMKGVILGINPAASIVDLNHQVPPQDLRQAAYFLRSVLPYFPSGVIHVVVVDPGVGTDRALLYVEVERHRLLVPDNGCWTSLVNDDAQPEVIRLAELRYWRLPVSATFHGRDILAPVAAHLTLGVDPAQLGPPTDEWVRLHLPMPRREEDRCFGEVVHVDRFGNLITNLPGELLATPAGRRACAVIGDHEVSRSVRTYAEAPTGAVVCLMSSNGYLEIAVVEGNAARTLQAGVGTPVVLALPSNES